MPRARSGTVRCAVKTTLQHELRQTLDRSPVGVDAPAVEWNETLQIIQEAGKRCKNSTRTRRAAG